MPDTPRAEQIEAEVLTRMEALLTAGTQNYTYREVSRKLRAPEAVSSHPVIFIPPGRETGDQEVAYNLRVLHLAIWGYHDTADEPGTCSNKIRQDIEMALFPTPPDAVILGLTDVEITGAAVVEVDRWQSMDDSQELVRLLVDFTFTYTRGDP